MHRGALRSWDTHLCCTGTGVRPQPLPRGAAAPRCLPALLCCCQGSEPVGSSESAVHVALCPVLGGGQEPWGVLGDGSVLF